MQDYLPLSHLVIPAVLIIWTTFNWGGLFEGRRWAVPVEWVRVVAVLVVGLLLMSKGFWIGATLAGFMLVSAIWLLSAPTKNWVQSEVAA